MQINMDFDPLAQAFGDQVSSKHFLGEQVSQGSYEMSSIGVIYSPILGERKFSAVFTLLFVHIRSMWKWILVPTTTSFPNLIFKMWFFCKPLKIQ